MTLILEMLIYGLTGGIGSGKSTVAGYFEEAGIFVSDADSLGHELLAGAGPEARAVAERFDDCTTGGGAIDRRKLGARVFSDPDERRWLEDLLHPAIGRRFLARLQRLDRPRPPVAVLEGAVLLESRTRFDLAGMVVVTAPEAVRIERLRKRDGHPDEHIRARLQAQMPEHEKILRASHLVDNSGTPEQTRRQVRATLDQMAKEIGERP